MNVLLVYAHPEPHHSFNAAMRDAIADEVTALGYQLLLSDLYSEDFDPRVSRADFLDQAQSDRFSVEIEQRAAAANARFAPAVEKEQQKLLEADAIILQFPLWWGGPPAILKGWFDRVSAYGVSYVEGSHFDTGLFKGRRALLSVTTGGIPHRFSDDGYYGSIDEILKPVQELFLGFLGYSVAPPHVAYAVPRISQQQREAALASLRQRVRELLAPPFERVSIPPSGELLEHAGTHDWRTPS